MNEKTGVLWAWLRNVLGWVGVSNYHIRVGVSYDHIRVGVSNDHILGSSTDDVQTIHILFVDSLHPC